MFLEWIIKYSTISESLDFNENLRVYQITERLFQIYLLCLAEDTQIKVRNMLMKRVGEVHKLNIENPSVKYLTNSIAGCQTYGNLSVRIRSSTRTSWRSGWRQPSIRWRRNTRQKSKERSSKLKLKKSFNFIFWKFAGSFPTSITSTERLAFTAVLSAALISFHLQQNTTLDQAGLPSTMSSTKRISGVGKMPLEVRRVLTFFRGIYSSNLVVFLLKHKDYFFFLS